MDEQQQTSIMTLGGLAQGAIGPRPRVDAGEISEQEVHDFVAALQGDALFSQITAVVPHKCVDGRFRADNVNSLGPDAAGGTESLVIGDALTYGMFCGPEDTASTHTKKVLQFWLDRQQHVGGHDADAAHGGSGCGACDKLDATLAYIATRGDELRSTIAGLGVEVDDETQATVTGRAQKLVSGQYADGGPAIIAAMRETAGVDAVETLTGEHKEVAVVINTKPVTTMDRGAIREQFGDKLQAFNVDVWALEKSANEMYNDAQKARALYYATLCYNVAVAAVLSDASLRIVVR